MEYKVGERKYAIGEKCDNCNTNQKKLSNLCQSCYNKKRYAKNLHTKSICGLCNQEKSIFANNVCRSCYYNKRYIEQKKALIDEGYDIGTYTKEKLPNCKGCNRSFTLVRRMAKNLCSSCYNKTFKERATDYCKKCGCQLDKARIKNICEHCSPVRGVKKKYVPENKQLTEMKLLVIKSKWNLLDEIDYFRIIDLYLQVVYHDEKLNKFSDIGTIQFCIKKFKEWCNLI